MKKDAMVVLGKMRSQREFFFLSQSFSRIIRKVKGPISIEIYIYLRVSFFPRWSSHKDILSGIRILIYKKTPSEYGTKYVNLISRSTNDPSIYKDG